jgi:hypothetical protein
MNKIILQYTTMKILLMEKSCTILQKQVIDGG